MTLKEFRDVTKDMDENLILISVGFSAILEVQEAKVIELHRDTLGSFWPNPSKELDPGNLDWKTTPVKGLFISTKVGNK